MTTSQTGFEKNLSLYEQMIAELKAETANYAPPLDKLSILNLKANVAPVNTALSSVRDGLTNYSFAVYGSNEPELTIEALDELSADLQLKNTAVAATDASLANAREQRNQLMYDLQNGIVPLSKSVKQYYKSKEGVNGVMYKRLVALLKPMR